MDEQNYADEVERARARGDAARLCSIIDSFDAYVASGEKDWNEEQAEEFIDLLDSYRDPDKALAYIVLAVSQSDNARFLAMIGAGVLEDLLETLPHEYIERVVAEARRSPRFRWLLNCPFKELVAGPVWDAIIPFRWTGPFEEPCCETLPPRS